MRCKACDSVLRDEEIFWRVEEKCWEDLCRNCRGHIFREEEDLDIEQLGIDIGNDDYERDE